MFLSVLCMCAHVLCGFIWVGTSESAGFGHCYPAHSKRKLLAGCWFTGGSYSCDQPATRQRNPKYENMLN